VLKATRPISKFYHLICALNR